VQLIERAARGTRVRVHGDGLIDFIDRGDLSGL
jgi:hypothetical protein